MPEVVSTPMIGSVIAHYHVVEKFGEGGMGVVHKDRDTRLNRFIVLKVLRSDALGDTDRKRRFVQETRAASTLNSPHISTNHDVADHDGLDYIVMEYVPGQPLDYLIRRVGCPWTMCFSSHCRSAMRSAPPMRRASSIGLSRRRTSCLRSPDSSSCSISGSRN